MLLVRPASLSDLQSIFEPMKILDFGLANHKTMVVTADATMSISVFNLEMNEEALEWESSSLILAGDYSIGTYPIRLFRFCRAVVASHLVVSDLLNEDWNFPVDQISAVPRHLVSASFCNDFTAAGGQAF